MARKKTAPVVAQDPPLPPPTTTAPECRLGGDSMATPSGSFSSISTVPTCPHCHSAFPELSTKDFQDHVGRCTRPTTANSGSSGSSLSSLLISQSPSSPDFSGVAPVITSPGAIPAAEVPEGHTSIPESDPVTANGVLGAGASADVISKVITEVVENDPIRPYLDPTKLFDYYDQGEPEEPEVDAKEPPNMSKTVEHAPYELFGGRPDLSDYEDPTPAIHENIDVAETLGSSAKLLLSKKTAAPKKSDPTPKFPFPKFTPVEIFEDYLNDPERLEYNALYLRTSKVADTLVAYQVEYDAIDKEIFAHESILAAERKRAEDDAKEVAEEQRKWDDIDRERVADRFKEQLKLESRKFQAFLVRFEERHPGDSDTPKHLRNLKNPQFMAAVNKRMRLAKNKENYLHGGPLPEVKPTKEEVAYEKRKRGKLMDAMKFDDMKTADAYGFDYSAHIKHLGAQPLSDAPRRSQNRTQARQTNGNGVPSVGIETGENTRTRIQRNKTKRPYDAELSASGDSEEDGFPAKRARRPKIFEDGIESTGRARATPYSRSDTPAVRTFASGKRVGRPPAKSKLQAVQMAPKSESPRLTSAGGAMDANGQGNGSVIRDLGAFAEAQLHDAAESLVNQTVSDNIAAAPPVKKKHAGGRPRKHPIVPPATSVPSELIAPEPVAPPKPRNKGGRPRKAQPLEGEESTIKIEAATRYDNDVLHSTEHDEISQDTSSSDYQRPKRKRTSADSDQSPIVVDSTPFQAIERPPKKRRNRVPPARKETTTDRDIPYGSDTKANGMQDGISMGRSASGSVVPGLFKKRKARGEGVLSFPSTEEPRREDDSDEDIDEESLDPEAREKLRLRRVAKQKSKKLSNSMKKRWASGGMGVAQETRRINNAKKKEAREKAMAEAAAAGIPYVPSEVISTLTSAPRSATSSIAIKKEPSTTFTTAPKTKPAKAIPAPKTPVPSKSKAPAKEKPSRKVKQPSPPPAQPRRTSTRPRKPRILGFDGADDEDGDDEDEDGLQSPLPLYDQFQDLTSPSGHALGKRKRNPLLHTSSYEEHEYDSDDSQVILEDDSDYN